MNVIDACFVCTSPYQVMTSINIVLHHNVQADLYVCSSFFYAKEIVDRIRLQKIFLHTVLVNVNEIEKYKNYKRKFFVHLGIARNYLRIDTIVKQFLLAETVYKKIYVSSKANVGRLLGLYFIKHHYEVETIYYDDGESSYNNKTFISPSKMDASLRRLVFGKRKIEVKKLLMYAPSLYRKFNLDSKMEVAKIPPLPQVEQTRELFNSIFNFTDDDIIQQKAVLLDIIRS